MSEAVEPIGGLLPLTVNERVDQVCDAFERDWRAGRAPRIENYLEGSAGPERAALLGELLLAELELLAAVDERPAAARYEARFPEDAALIAAVFRAFAETPLPPREAGPMAIEIAHRRSGESTTSRVERDPASTLGVVGSAGTAEGPGPDPARGGSRKTPSLPEVAGFEMLGEIGRGGMGVVYLARDVRLNRQCALKMIRGGSLAGPRDTARFLAEAETAARLRHPNVVQVYGLGEWQGLPYLELEYLDGGSLADRLDGTPMTALDAARIVESLAGAIDAAHGLGVFHRYLKPANILVAADGTPKVADFGLAKAAGVVSGETPSGDIVGTPSYMAPEQASGHSRGVGAEADVYALGAVLYELLTGRPPFKAATVIETLEQVRNAEPVPPCQLVPSLPRDLEAVCLKCLEKEPWRRYRSAAGLARDLACFREGRPTVARPIGAVGRAIRWCRRNRLVASLTAAIAVLLFAIAVGSAVAAVRSGAYATRERALRLEAEEARTIALKDRALAVSNLARARAVVDEMYTGVSNDLANAPGMDGYQRSLLEKALVFYETVALPQTRDPVVRFEAASAALRVAFIRGKLDRTNSAVESLARALSLLEGLAAEFPDEPKFRSALAEAYSYQAMSLRNAGRLSPARDYFVRGIALREKLVQHEPTSLLYQEELARYISTSFDVAEPAGLTPEGEQSLRRAEEIIRRLLVNDPAAPRLRSRLARLRGQLAAVYGVTGRTTVAEKESEAAVKILESLTAEHPRDRVYRYWLACELSDLAQWLDPVNWRRAEDTYQRAIALFERLAEDSPELTAYRFSLEITLGRLARLQRRFGKVREAEASFRREIQIVEPLLAVNPDRLGLRLSLGAALSNLGGVARLTTGRSAEAVSHLDRALNVLEAVQSEHHGHPQARRFLSITYFERACAIDALGRTKEVLADLDRAHDYADGPRRSWVLGRRAVVKAIYGDPAGSAVDAAAAVRDPEASTETLEDSARALALASAACRTGGGAGTGPEDRERYQKSAVELLRRVSLGGSARGSELVALLRQSPHLNSLRTRLDFQALLLDAGFPSLPFGQ